MVCSVVRSKQVSHEKRLVKGNPSSGIVQQIPQIPSVPQHVKFSFFLFNFFEGLQITVQDYSSWTS